MASVITPLSQRPWRWLWALVPLLLLILPLTELGSSYFTKPPPHVAWAVGLYALAFAGALCWTLTTMAITGYDADYLYLFQQTNSQAIPLGSFYKLIPARGYWKLYYLDAQQQAQKVQVVPLRTGWSWRSYSANIRGFAAAVRHHNPHLEVREGLLG